jgi:hypothetical protein
MSLNLTPISVDVNKIGKKSFKRTPCVYNSLKSRAILEKNYCFYDFHLLHNNEFGDF